MLLAIREFALLWKHRRVQRALPREVRSSIRPLLGFWKWATLSALVCPFLFKGMRVIDPRSDSGDAASAFFFKGETSPLHWSFGNLGQVIYLTLNLIAVLYVLRPRRDSNEARLSAGALRTTFAIVALTALLQSVIAWKGWNFPYSFFNGNPAYTQAFEAQLEDVRRVSSTFTEASSAGGFLAAAALGLLATRLSGRNIGRALIFLAVGGLILTTATTGYVAFLVGVFGMLIYFAYGSMRGRLSPRALWRSVLASSVVFVLILSLLVIVPPLRQAALESTFNKGDTYSFLVRTSIDWYSIQLLFKTYGLGVGLGSNRPSSFTTYLLGNVGLIGTFLFALFAARLCKQLFEASRRPGNPSAAMVAWTLVGLLIAEGLALPDLSWPPLWAVIIVGFSVLASREERAERYIRVVSPLPVETPSPAIPAVV